MLSYEQIAWQQGKKRVAGVDEAGRGPLAGPVVAAAVILPSNIDEILSQKEPSESDHYFFKINDSKKLTPKKREELFLFLMEDSRVHKATALVDAQKIDQINILNATYLAMQQAVSQIDPIPNHVLFDGWAMPEKFFSALPTSLTQEGVVKGDSKSLSIAAASILAKVTRDRLMLEYEKEFPGYNFSTHKGYGTKDHVAKIHELGPAPIHRKSFAPIRDLLRP